ncbi:hypothetical protein PIB30_067024 [Stylosanthes scabra]|uniref:Uncharacterized protein n=1 Tax=Stylosanthes scabra TaxID=79078 RepID=A0ABU6ZL63_9FABA|nr:hypothetical protein [Stylosanthes scabra]
MSENTEATASAGKSQKTFLTGSEMRKDRGKKAIVVEMSSDTQDSILYVPEIQSEGVTGAGHKQSWNHHYKGATNEIIEVHERGKEDESMEGIIVGKSRIIQSLQTYKPNKENKLWTMAQWQWRQQWWA